MVDLKLSSLDCSKDIAQLVICKRYCLHCSVEKASLHPRALSISKHDEAGSHCFGKYLTHHEKVSSRLCYIWNVKTVLPIGGFKT